MGDERHSAIDACSVLGRYYRVLGGSVQVVGHHPATDWEPEAVGVRSLTTQRTMYLTAACWRELISAGAVVDD